MCGVIGLVYENHHPQLGRIAAELLKTLEYRGYDSTGAAIQGAGTEVRLAKGVGAPLVSAAARLQGSYAAVIVDPLTRTAWAVKQGSSLYFGFGSDAQGGRFTIASSDLSSILKLTRVLVPLSEGEFVEYGAEG